MIDLAVDWTVPVAGTHKENSTIFQYAARFRNNSLPFRYVFKQILRETDIKRIVGKGEPSRISHKKIDFQSLLRRQIRRILQKSRVPIDSDWPLTLPRPSQAVVPHSTSNVQHPFCRLELRQRCDPLVRLSLQVLLLEASDSQIYIFVCSGQLILPRFF